MEVTSKMGWDREAWSKNVCVHCAGVLSENLTKRAMEEGGAGLRAGEGCGQKMSALMEPSHSMEPGIWLAEKIS